MKQKEIISGIRLHIDEGMEKVGFKFTSRRGDYLKFDSQNQLYFEVSLLFLDFVDKATNHKSKYLEIYLNVYHSEISKLLLEITTRGKNLDSIFYFKIVGNMLSDIVLNPDWCNYSNRNNHNYFRITFVTENNIEARSEQILSLVKKYAIPFFEKLDSLEKIKNALDCCYNKGLSIHNGNVERLLALTALLYHFNDSLKENKIQVMRDYFISIRHNEAVLELDALIQKLETS